MFSPEIGLMIWTTVTFLLVLGVLGRFAFKPMNEMLAKRQEMIRQTIKEAEHTQEEATKLLNEYKVQLDKARAESEEIIARGRKVGETSKEEITAEARAEAEKMLKRAEEAMSRERKEMMDDIRREVADMTISAAEKVVKKSLDAKDHVRLIEDAIKEVKGV